MIRQQSPHASNETDLPNIVKPWRKFVIGLLAFEEKRDSVSLSALFIYLDFASLVEDRALLIRLELSEFWCGLYWKGSLSDIILDFKAVAPHFFGLTVFRRFSRVWLFATLWFPCQAPLSRGFSRQEYWSGLPCPPPGDLPDSGIEPVSLASSALAGIFFIISVFKTRSTCQVCNADSLKEWIHKDEIVEGWEEREKAKFNF